MPSHLRLHSEFEPITAETTRSYFVSSPPQKKQKMSLTQTYYIASSARTKLGREACKPDHDLRLLVGHANLLDSLMLELQHAEREQEAWFNRNVRQMEEEAEEQEQQHARHIQWAEPIMEDDEEDMDDSASDISDTDSESDLEEDFQLAIPIGRIRVPAVTVTTSEVDEDYDDEEEAYEDEEFGAELMRVPSNQPPELVLDSDESDDESPPASPPQPTLDFDDAHRKQTIAASGYTSTKPLSPSQQHALIQDGFFIPERNNGLLIATY